MRRTVSCSLLLLLASFSPSRIDAQAGAPSLSAVETAVACAPPLTTDDAPPNSPRIIGAQDTTARALYGPRDLLVVGAGTSSGLQLGQQFFVRRANRFGSSADRRWQGARTLGWIRLVAVSDSTAIAAVDHGCDVISQGDYIEPFTAPVVPADVEHDRPAGDPDFTAIGRVLAGLEDRQSAGPGGYVLIDRGTDQGVTAGARYAIYRDVRSAGMPLASVGEAVVLSTGKTLALTKITSAHDAVLSGDYVAPRR
jgi:hypothetical protein